MKKSIYKLSILLTLTIAFTNCDNDNDPTNNVCDENYVTQTITDAFSVANGYVDLPEWMDLEIHEYEIQISADGEICSIGYENPSTYSGAYTMEVINVTTNTSYSGVHTFLQTGISFQSITPTVIVSNGDIIRVKRVLQPASYTTIPEQTGRVLKIIAANVPYPITQGNVTFLSSKFYGAGGPIHNIAQPYIPLGFKVN